MGNTVDKESPKTIDNDLQKAKYVRNHALEYPLEAQYAKEPPTTNIVVATDNYLFKKREKKD